MSKKKKPESIKEEILEEERLLKLMYKLDITFNGTDEELFNMNEPENLDKMNKIVKEKLRKKFPDSPSLSK